MENVSYCKKIILLQKKLFLRLTEEEKYKFQEIFNNLDKNKNGYIKIQNAIDFLKTSHLSEEILKQIISICRIQNGLFYRNEFYIALRLIALAQNNFPFTEQEIINNSPIPSLPTFQLPVFKKPNKYPIFDPNDFININTIYEFLKKFEENMNYKYEKLNERIEEIDKKNENANLEIISLLSQLLEKEKKSINQSNHNIDHNEKFVKIKNSNINVNKIEIPFEKISIKQNRNSPDPNANRNHNYLKLPNYNISQKNVKLAKDKKAQYHPKNPGENINLNLIKEDVFISNNNLKLFNYENNNNNLKDKGSTNKYFTPFYGEKVEKNLDSFIS